MSQIPDDIGGRARVSMTSDGCAGTINAVNHLEHIQCKVRCQILGYVLNFALAILFAKCYLTFENQQPNQLS